MANFGKYTLLQNKRHNLTKEPQWWWEFKPTTTLDEINRRQWMEKNMRFITGPDGKTIAMTPLWQMIAVYDLALSFGGTNIPNIDGLLVEEGSLPFVNVSDTLDERITLIGLLPMEMVEELWMELGKVNPFLGPLLPNEESPEEKEPSKKNSKS